MLRGLLGILAPPLCIVCGADAGRAAPLCRGCRADLARAALQNGQIRGSGPVAARVAAATIAAPAASTVVAWSAFPYDGPAGAIVRALKFGGRTALADVMAAQLVALAPPGLIDGTLVPVPAHPVRLRRRGFGQAALLAAALARRTGCPASDRLRRRGDPRPQTGRSRSARLRSLEGAIYLDPAAPPPDRALLVDDVVTTGATLAACARCLRENGSQVLGAITYARTGGR